MAGILAGILEAGFKGGEINPYISTDLNENTPVTFSPLNYITLADGINLSGGYNLYRIASANRQQIAGNEQPNFFYDYYFRVHITPQELDLKAVASEQTRQFQVWNAWPTTTAQLANVLSSNSTGITITGQAAPYAMPPLQELTYSVTVGISGPPNINADVLFDFSNVADPLPILIVGLRAIKFDVVPEVPVKERWEWLSDVIVAVDGTEQRIALRGEVPRVEMGLNVIFSSSEEIRRFYADLATSYGRLWVPEYQYTTRTTATSDAGSTQIYFDRGQTDIREGEYALVQTSPAIMVGIISLNASGGVISTPLANAIPAGTLIMPGAPALIDDQAAIDRYAVNDVGEVRLNCTMVRQRSALTRPGATVTLPTFLGAPVVDKRPLANGLVADAVSTGQIQLDNHVGMPDIISRWDYARVGGPRSFKINRIKDPAEMDYWRAVLAHCRGQARKFWIPTYRDDLSLAVQPLDATTTYTVGGNYYAEKLWPLLSHRYIEIETDAGIHRTSVTSASVSGDNTIILLSVGLPTGAGWMVVKRISFLLPVRLSEDEVTLDHYGYETILNLSIRTAEP